MHLFKTTSLTTLLMLTQFSPLTLAQDPISSDSQTNPQGTSNEQSLELAVNTDGQQPQAGAADIETMTVTATRQRQTFSPDSIDVIDGIDELEATHIHEVMNRSPGTWISRGNGQEHLTAVRSPVYVGAGGCGPFLMTEDNIAIRSPAFCNVNQLFDVNYEQAKAIEVMRGPGTAFHGSSAMQGIINVISPDFSATDQLKLSADYGSHDYFRLLVDQRSSDQIMQANIAKDNGYKDDSGYQQQKIRIKRRHKLNDSTTYTQQLNIMNLDQETATYVSGKDAYKDEDRKKENPNPEAFRKASSMRYQGSFEIQSSSNSVLVVSPYARWNDMEFLMHFLPGTPLEENGHSSLGVQSAFYRSYNASTEITTGFDLDLTQGFLKQSQKSAEGPNFPAGKQYDYEVDVFTAAPFIQAFTRFNEQWDIRYGLRLEYSYYDYTNKLDDGDACLPGATRCRYSRPASDSLDFKNAAPDVALRYQFIDDNFSYLKLARGYRAPNTSELFRLEQGQELADIDSERIDSVEFGLQGLLGKQHFYHIAFYRMEKDNVIFKTSDRQNVDNQKTSHQGIELSLSWQILPNLSADLASTYAKHQYNSNLQLFNTSDDNIKGNIIDTAPRHIHNLSVHWRPSSSSSLELETVYLGRYFLDPQNSFSYDGHQLYHFRYLQQLNHGWEFGLALINLSDEDYADRADVTVIFFNSPPQEERYFIGEPRNFRLSINKTF